MVAPASSLAVAGDARRTLQSDSGLTPRRARFRLHGSDSAWAIAFVVPYAAVFLLFVVYPAAFGLWMGRDPGLYDILWSDPRYVTIAVNTALFAVIGVNLQMAGAFLLSGFFIGPGRWRRALLAIYLLPWALPSLAAFLSIHYMVVTQYGFLDSLWLAITGSDGPLILLSRWSAMAANILAYIWKWMPFWTLVFLAARMALPRVVYAAAAIDGASATDTLIHITVPLLANVYLVCTLLATIWTIGDFSTVYFVSYGAPARQTDVLATYGYRAAFDFGRPSLGVAAMLSVLPVLIPLVILLMRRVRRLGVQL